MTRLRPWPQPSRAPVAGPLPRPDPVTRLPIVVVQPNAGCDCHCAMCDIWKSGSRERVSPDEWSRWTEEWVELGVERVVLSGGEPLLHPQLPSYCRQLKQRGMAITVLSSGRALTRAWPNLAELVDDLVVSLDGPPDIHDKIRGVRSAFEMLERGVGLVRRMSPQTRVTARCTVQRGNCRHLCDTVDTGRALAVWSLSFLAVDVSSRAFNRDRPWSEARAASVLPAIEDLQHLEAQLDLLEMKYVQDFESGFLAESGQKLRARLLAYFRAVHGLAAHEPPRCNAPWVSAVIEPDGTVRPCFFHRSLGQVNEDTSLASLLNSSLATEFRAALDPAVDATCRSCVCSLALESPK